MRTQLAARRRTPTPASGAGGGSGFPASATFDTCATDGGDGFVILTFVAEPGLPGATTPPAADPASAVSAQATSTG